MTAGRHCVHPPATLLPGIGRLRFSQAGWGFLRRSRNASALAPTHHAPSGGRGGVGKRGGQEGGSHGRPWVETELAGAQKAGPGRAEVFTKGSRSLHFPTHTPAVPAATDPAAGAGAAGAGSTRPGRWARTVVMALTSSSRSATVANRPLSERPLMSMSPFPSAVFITRLLLSWKSFTFISARRRAVTHDEHTS